MSKYKDMVKEKWQEKPSVRGNVRGKVSGLVHRNKSDDAPTHVARPVSELRDPASFAPPPKRTGSGLAPPPPRSTGARQVAATPSKYQDPRGPIGAAPGNVSHSQERLEYQAEQRQLQGSQEEEETAPREPYRVNTTGLETNNLPLPPRRRDGADGRNPPPPSYEAVTNQPVQPPQPAAPAKPSLPPRLPPRTNSSATATPTSPESSSGGNNILNQGAVNRLGAAGVSVPDLGIGNRGGSSTNPPPPPSRQPNTQVNKLQDRFGRLNTNQPQDQQPPAEGTTWAQKQAALNTASSFQKDPSSVSFSDAKAATATANNFRQRHGDQVAAGVRSTNKLNQKHGIANKVGAYAGGGQQDQQDQAQGSQTTTGARGELASTVSGLSGKKKPPPPPPKKPGLGGSAPSAPPPAAQEDEPPPIPMATRPTF